MNDELRDRLYAYFLWYEELYGDTLYIDPDLFLKESEKAPPGRTEDKSKTPLKAFYHNIADCQHCPLAKTRQQLVFGSGNESAGLMFIGEAPGRDEDLQGLPFVGKAGQLLNKLFEQVGLDRSALYIANILKCRPPNNRDPKPDEVEKCIPHLHKQISLVQPRLLVALGRVAARNLLQSADSLGRLRNRLWRYQGIPLIVTFHPAYILRNEQMFNSAVEDMRYILSAYHNIIESVSKPSS